MAYAIQSTRFNHTGQVQTASGLDVLAAIWLFISGFVVHGSYTMAWNDWIFAVIIGFFALCRTFGAYRQSWLSWLNFLMGIWVLISPWVLMGTPTQAMIVNNVITGGVIIILSGWSALASGSGATAQTAEVRRDEVPPARP
jgi:hypothetical protein